MALHFYAAQSPRGALNEVFVHRFRTSPAIAAWAGDYARCLGWAWVEYGDAS